jgi:hypothetical protein
VAPLFQQPANPRRMGSDLDGYAQLLLRVKAPPEGFGGGTQPTFFEHFTALDIQKTQLSVVVSEIQSGCHHRCSSATIIHGRASFHCEPLTL